MSEIGTREARGKREYRIIIPLSDAERELVHSCDFQISNVLTPIIGALSLWEENLPEILPQRRSATVQAQRCQERLHHEVNRLEQTLPALDQSTRPELKEFHRLMVSSLDFMKRLTRIANLAVEFMHTHQTATFAEDDPARGRLSAYMTGLQDTMQQFRSLMAKVDAHPVYQSYRAVTPEDQRHHAPVVDPL